MVTGTLITLIFYFISLGILVVHLKNGNKNYFLLSVVFIIFGSINYNLLVVSDYKYVIFLFALLFSFIGDLFMASKIKIVENRIINGIIGFGIAHILYIFAFYRLGKKEFYFWQFFLGIFAFLVIYRVAVYTPLLSRILLVGTLVYSAILVTLLMIISAFAFSNEYSIITSLVALIGVVLFILSDSIIAYTEFKGTISNSSQLIAVTYIISQIMLQGTVILIEGTI